MREPEAAQYQEAAIEGARSRQSGGGPLGAGFHWLLGSAFCLCLGVLFQYHTVDSVRAKDTWNLADYAGHYFAGVIAGQVLALCAIPAGWLIGRALGPRRLVALAPILGPAAVLVATGLVALAAPSIQVLETSDAEDLIPSLLIVMVPVGVALGLVVRRSAGRLVGAFAQ